MGAVYFAGGAVYLDFSNDLNWFDNATFVGNEATEGSGGAVFCGYKVRNYPHNRMHSPVIFI